MLVSVLPRNTYPSIHPVSWNLGHESFVGSYMGTDPRLTVRAREDDDDNEVLVVGSRIAHALRSRAVLGISGPTLSVTGRVWHLSSLVESKAEEQHAEGSGRRFRSRSSLLDERMRSWLLRDFPFF